MAAWSAGEGHLAGRTGCDGRGILGFGLDLGQGEGDVVQFLRAAADAPMPPPLALVLLLLPEWLEKAAAPAAFLADFDANADCHSHFCLQRRHHHLVLEGVATNADAPHTGLLNN